jgi:hypothetical protein
MAIETTKGRDFRVIPSAVHLVALLVVGFASSLNGVSQAKAQNLDRSTFCRHYHEWASSGTTGPPCSLDAGLVTPSEFCKHQHKFALNFTSKVKGNLDVAGWCRDNKTAKNTGVPLDEFEFHYHNNAGTGTTGPQ